jgi:hypothetical protein
MERLVTVSKWLGVGAALYLGVRAVGLPTTWSMILFGCYVGAALGRLLYAWLASLRSPEGLRIIATFWCLFWIRVVISAHEVTSDWLQVLWLVLPFFLAHVFTVWLSFEWDRDQPR